GYDVDPRGRPAPVPGGGQSEERDRDVHQLARRRRDVRACDLRHDAICPPGGLHSMRRPSRLHGIAAAGCRPEGHAVRTPELAHHAASTVGWLPGASDRHHASCPGDLESQETSQRDLREAHRPAAQRRVAQLVADRIAAFREGLRKEEFVQDRNATFEFRWMEGQGYDRAGGRTKKCKIKEKGHRPKWGREFLGGGNQISGGPALNYAKFRNFFVGGGEGWGGQRSESETNMNSMYLANLSP